MTNLQKLENTIKDILIAEPWFKTIHLEHILLAIEKGNKKGVGTIVVSHFGTVYELQNPINNFSYDLSKPLADQSEETITKLLELIN